MMRRVSGTERPCVSWRTRARALRKPSSSNIFEEFQQADSSSTREKGGTGLGLAIAKRIVELHGGRIWVDSEPGRGLDVLVHAPVRVERQEEAR